MKRRRIQHVDDPLVQSVNERERGKKNPKHKMKADLFFTSEFNGRGCSLESPGLFGFLGFTVGAKRAIC